jgi:hypothetical protein
VRTAPTPSASTIPTTRSFPDAEPAANGRARRRHSPPDGLRTGDATNGSRPAGEPLSTNGAAGERFDFPPWLVAWLIDAGFAEHVDGTLVATPAGIELGALLG